MVKGQKFNAEEVMATATKALEKISRYDGSLEEKDKVNDDPNLVEVIYAMLQSIPNGMSKTLLKLELKQDYSSKIEWLSSRS